MGHVACMGEKRNAEGVLVGKSEGKRPSGRYRHRQEDNIKIDLKELGWDGVDQIQLALNRERWWAVVDMVMILLFPQNVVIS